MFELFIVLIAIVSILLILIVMAQTPKEGGLSGSFGGGGSQILGAKKTGDFLTKSTWTLATVLAVLILASNLFIKEPSETALDGESLEAPAVDSSFSTDEEETTTDDAATTEDSVN